MAAKSIIFAEAMPRIARAGSAVLTLSHMSTKSRSSVPSILVVGGTGPTGRPLVNTLLRNGYRVTIYHTGSHEVKSDADVEHLHGGPRDTDDIRT